MGYVILASYQIFTICSSGACANCEQKLSQFEFTDQMDNASQNHQDVHEEESSPGDDSVQSTGTNAERGRERSTMPIDSSLSQEAVEEENIYSEIILSPTSRPDTILTFFKLTVVIGYI